MKKNFIEKCLNSLVEQDYDDYEIIAINDSSNDSTGDIMKKYSEKFSKVIFVDAKPKPDGWMGKKTGRVWKDIKNLREIYCYLLMLILFIQVL